MTHASTDSRAPPTEKSCGEEISTVVYLSASVRYASSGRQRGEVCTPTLLFSDQPREEMNETWTPDQRRDRETNAPRRDSRLRTGLRIEFRRAGGNAIAPEDLPDRRPVRRGRRHRHRKPQRHQDG